MRILYITFTSGGGGATKALVNLVNGMIALGHEVFVLTRNNNDYLPQMVEAAGGTVLYGPVSLTIYPKGGRFLGRIRRFFISLTEWRKSRKQIGEIIDKYQIQIVHSNVGPMNLALKACQKRGIPHVWHLREYQDLDFGMTFFPSKSAFRNMIHQKGNYNIAITENVYNYYDLRNDIDRVIYDGVFPEAIQKEVAPKESKEDYFLFVGRIEIAKGPHLILKPFAEFLKKYPDYRLKIAGAYRDGNHYCQKLKETVAAYHLEESVEFLGNRDDVYDLMQKAKALVVPSRFEGFGFITAEAMMNNCVVIGRNTAGTKEQFDVGVKLTGQEIGLRFNDEEELLQCMYKAVESDTTQMRQKARTVAIQNYTLENSARSVDEYYKNICKKQTKNG